MNERTAVRAAPGTESAKRLLAYVVGPEAGVELMPAPAGRAWMDATRDRFANRCLPLRIANQAGWFVVNQATVRAVWNGGDDPRDVELAFDRPTSGVRATSHFGHGIVTWRLPYLFRTPPGYNLLVRGPANWPKPGAFPLEGLVETDWTAATFTMNWQLTIVGSEVAFAAGEPIAMLVPQPRGDLEAFAPSVVDVSSDPSLATRYRRWFVSRQRFLRELKLPGSPASEAGWQRDYLLGTDADGGAAPEHQMRLRLRAPTRAMDPAGSYREEGDAMPLRPFERDDIDDVNQVLRHYPEVAEVIRSVQSLSKGLTYPIVDAVELVDRLAGSEVVLRGRSYAREELAAVLPEYYFPITSEDDLVAKVADLTRRDEDALLDGLDGDPAWGRQLEELPPGVTRPDFDAMEVPAPPGVAHVLGVGGPRDAP